MKTKELRALLHAAAAKQKARAEAMTGNDNPQTVALRLMCDTTSETLEAVIEALDAPRPGAAYQLNILAR